MAGQISSCACCDSTSGKPAWVSVSRVPAALGESSTVMTVSAPLVPGDTHVISTSRSTSSLKKRP
jgi:hypothetical protein